MTTIPLISLMLFFIALIVVSVFTVFVCTQNKFLVTSDGIRFPLRCLFELRWRLYRSWQEMDQICFAESGLRASHYLPSECPDMMVVSFKDGGYLPLELSAFRREDLQNFVLASAVLCPNLPIEPPLAEVKLGITAENTAQKALSFTQIWEDDMASRFGSTVLRRLSPDKS